MRARRELDWLVARIKRNIKPRNERVDKVVAGRRQLKGRLERQVLLGHSQNINVLQEHVISTNEI